MLKRGMKFIWRFILKEPKTVKGFCLVCGQECYLVDSFKWYFGKWISFRSKVFFWKRRNLGFCFACWIRALIQAYRLNPEKKERLKIIDMMT